MTTETVLAEIGDLIRQVLDGYDIDAVPITPDTSFDADLAFESIDLVVLGTLLTERYGPGIDLAGFLSTRSLPEIITLRVGDLAGYVTARLEHA
ncbi:acyl carrier protein [Actinoplanes sp. NPDC049802]|uniref:acyl carrier protein n=1 Tax=Actinoplanes sp. NPDC049802 TaxID=3154742 RepID=UPI0033C0A868